MHDVQSYDDNEDQAFGGLQGFCVYFFGRGLCTKLDTNVK